MTENYEQFRHYPNQEEIGRWIKSIWELADNTKCKAEILYKSGFAQNLGVSHNESEFTYVKFSPEGFDEFYGYWQPAMSAPAPLLIHVPGYGAEISAHPDLVAQGYNVLHISPLGYTTPDGSAESRKINGTWPVFIDTVTTGAEGGYKLWLVDCILAIMWAMEREEVIKNRVSFFGSSQGGGASLILGSIFKDRGVRCVAADVAFLTNYPMATSFSTVNESAYALALWGLNMVDDKSAGWKTLGFFDTISHAARLTCPVLLTAGGKDKTCPHETIESLFRLLPGTRSYSYFENLTHRYSREFIHMACSWFRMYA